MRQSNLKKKKILCVFAHPDDEAFGPGGTITFWFQQGAEIHLLCATKGESGLNHLKNAHDGIRVKELKKAAKILGISKIQFLGFMDGKISNNDLEKLEAQITKKIKSFRSDIILTFNLNGVSGHMDHIAVASATTQAFKKTKIAKKLYYYTLLDEHTLDFKDNYFIHFPDGFDKDDIDETIDVSKVWEAKVLAMNEHKSQIHDVKRILKNWEKFEKKEHFMTLSK